MNFEGQGSVIRLGAVPARARLRVEVHSRDVHVSAGKIDPRAKIEFLYYQPRTVRLKAEFKSITLKYQMNSINKRRRGGLHLWKSAHIEMKGGHWRIDQELPEIEIGISGIEAEETNVVGNVTINTLRGTGNYHLGQGVRLRGRSSNFNPPNQALSSISEFDIEVSETLVCDCSIETCNIKASEVVFYSNAFQVGINATTFTSSANVIEARYIDVTGDLTAKSISLCANKGENQPGHFSIGRGMQINADCELGGNRLLASDVSIGGSIRYGEGIECKNLLVQNDCQEIGTIQGEMVVVHGRLQVLYTIEAVHVFVGQEISAPNVMVHGNATMPESHYNVRELIWMPIKERHDSASQMEGYDEQEMSKSLRVSYDRESVDGIFEAIYGIDFGKTISPIEVSENTSMFELAGSHSAMEVEEIRLCSDDCELHFREGSWNIGSISFLSKGKNNTVTFHVKGETNIRIWRRSEGRQMYFDDKKDFLVGEEIITIPQSLWSLTQSQFRNIPEEERLGKLVVKGKGTIELKGSQG